MQASVSSFPLQTRTPSEGAACVEARSFVFSDGHHGHRCCALRRLRCYVLHRLKRAHHLRIHHQTCRRRKTAPCCPDHHRRMGERVASRLRHTTASSAHKDHRSSALVGYSLHRSCSFLCLADTNLLARNEHWVQSSS